MKTSRLNFLSFALSFILFSTAALGQGVFIPPQTALKNINGIVMPIANATITVCAGNAAGMPCSPALINAIFKDSGLTQPLSNPFTADQNGNYQFAAAASTYTVTVSAAGFSGYSYQITMATSSVTIQTNGVANIAQSPLNFVNANGCTFSNASAGVEQVSCAGSGGGGNPALDNCTPDESITSPFYSVVGLTNYFYASWEFCVSTLTCAGYPGSSYINCTIYIPTAQTGAVILLDLAANDATAGHTMSVQTCDQVVNTGTMNASSLTCAAAQTFTTTSTAYNRVILSFNVQSTLANGSILVVKILTTASGTVPTSNLLIYPHFIL